MREFRTYGSVRGALSNEHPYRDLLPPTPILLSLAAAFGRRRQCHIGHRYYAELGSNYHHTSGHSSPQLSSRYQRLARAAAYRAAP